jgi:hypothetical protein
MIGAIMPFMGWICFYGYKYIEIPESEEEKIPYVTEVTYGETAYAVGSRCKKYIKTPDSEEEKYHMLPE